MGRTIGPAEGFRSGRPHPNQKSYVCTHVFTNERPVLYVTRPDGSWCFLCGGSDHADGATAFRVVGLSHLVERDGSVGAVLDLGSDEEAERGAIGEDWVRSRY